MKKLITLLFSAVLLLSMPVMAAEVDQSRIVNIDASKSIIALGADLSAEQRATVLSLMDVTEADLANYQVVTITNDMEHQYLDAYMDASVIVPIAFQREDHACRKRTWCTCYNKNINYCTTGMYRNALLTAGVSDADILVVGPTEISGTAALIGAIKGYEAMSGESVSDTTLDTAMNELITTGEIAMQDADSQDIEELIAFVKAKVAAGGLDSDDQIRSAIEEGEDKFGVTLTEDEINQIIAIMQKINQLGLDPNVLVSQAEDLYSKFGKDFLKNLDTDAIAKEVAKSAASGFLQRSVMRSKDFCRIVSVNDISDP